MNNPRILVIDDDAVVRLTFEAVLKSVGYDVILAQDGVVGLKLFLEAKPDLVITDIIMPEKEGIETIREIRERQPDAKILATSGGGRIGNTDFLKIAQQFGAAGIIAKPFNQKELLGIVSRCLYGL